MLKLLECLNVTFQLIFKTHSIKEDLAQCTFFKVSNILEMYAKMNDKKKSSRTLSQSSVCKSQSSTFVRSFKLCVQWLY